MDPEETTHNKENMMRAVVLSHCCKAEELQVSHLERPEPRPGWAVVRVRAAGLNHSEVVLRTVEADFDYIHTPVVPGIECVGEVFATAAGSKLRVGQRVMALMGGMGRSFDGSYAEYALLPETHVFPTCSRLDWLRLAAVPETYYTAYGSLFGSLLLQPGDVLLVRGATSTVGLAALQLAKAAGARVVAACRRDEAFPELLRLGADSCVVDDGKLADRSFPERPNKVLELIGPKTLQDSLRVVSAPGYVCCTGVLGKVYHVSQFDPIKYLPNGVFLSSFYSNTPTQEALDAMMTLMERGGIEPQYSRVFILEEIAQAHALLEQGGAGGKIILDLC